MYEQYTDKQIVEMLKPKLAKLGWGTTVDHLERYPSTCEVIATIYRSAYIRGKLGRSFIIGEPKQTKPKQTERWVPVTGANLYEGAKVRFLNALKHEYSPILYPEPGTVGEVMKVCSGETCRVQWPYFYTSLFVRWSDLEVLLCE